MHLLDGFRSSMQSIYSHKFRSILTLLGIIIGVLAVVTMFSSVYALKTLIKTNMESMGWNNSLLVTPAYETQPSRVSRRMRFQRTTENVPALNYADFTALKEAVKYKTIYGMIENQTFFYVKDKTIQVSMKGTNREYFITKTYPLLWGRYFSEYEETNGSHVVVLGYYFAREQFGDKNPVGQLITLGKHRFLIIGVLDKDKLASRQGMNFNTWERNNDLKAVYVPLFFSAQYLTPNKMVHYIYLQAADEEEYALMKTRTRQLLLARHSMYQNFAFQDIGDILLRITKEIDENMRKWNITLFVIASISLIVGGIGLFSMLLISIQEKMLEIGVRKSIGATEGDIFFLFIFEAISLAVLGALLGIGLAWLTLLGMQSAIKIPMSLPIQGVALGLLFSVFIGFASGLYPALKAARIDPIQAIYYFE